MYCMGLVCTVQRIHVRSRLLYTHVKTRTNENGRLAPRFLCDHFAPCLVRVYWVRHVGLYTRLINTATFAAQTGAPWREALVSLKRTMGLHKRKKIWVRKDVISAGLKSGDRETLLCHQQYVGLRTPCASVLHNYVHCSTSTSLLAWRSNHYSPVPVACCGMTWAIRGVAAYSVLLLCGIDTNRWQTNNYVQE